MTGLLHFQLDGQISCELTILFIKKQTKTDIICDYHSKILGIKGILRWSESHNKRLFIIFICMDYVFYQKKIIIHEER